MLCPIPMSAVLRNQAVLTPATPFMPRARSGRGNQHLGLDPKPVGSSLACTEQGAFRETYTSKLQFQIRRNMLQQGARHRTDSSAVWGVRAVVCSHLM